MNFLLFFFFYFPFHIIKFFLFFFSDWKDQGNFDDSFLSNCGIIFFLFRDFTILRVWIIEYFLLLFEVGNFLFFFFLIVKVMEKLKEGCSEGILKNTKVYGMRNEVSFEVVNCVLVFRYLLFYYFLLLG